VLEPGISIFPKQASFGNWITEACDNIDLY